MRRMLLFFFITYPFASSSQTTPRLAALIRNITAFDPQHPAAHVMSIQVGIYFEHLFAIDEKDYEFTADFYIAQRWQDPRWTNLNWTNEFRQYGLVDSDKTCDNNGSTAAFLELGSDEFDLVWRPDLHLRNVRKSDSRVHSQIIRIFENGQHEFITYMWAILNMQDADYHRYPFDSQTLEVMIESLSHTTKRITLSPWLELTGLDTSLTHHWPGWEYVSHEGRAVELVPEYSHTSPCRREKIGRVIFSFRVKRHFEIQEIIPILCLVITSWGGLFIRVQSLMPRVATGFISYLTLSNLANAQLAKIPQLNYAVWYTVFLDTCRYGVFLSVLETLSAQYLLDCVSTRIAVDLDRWSRVVLPADFVGIVSMLLLLRDAEFVDVMWTISMINIFAVMTVTFGFVVYRYKRLKALLRHDPMPTYLHGHPPLDRHECGFIFHAINPHGDHDSVATVDDITTWLATRPSLSCKVEEERVHELKARLNQRIGETALTVESFIQLSKVIFIEYRAWEKWLTKEQKHGTTRVNSDHRDNQSAEISVVPHADPFRREKKVTSSDTAPHAGEHDNDDNDEDNPLQLAEV